MLAGIIKQVEEQLTALKTELDFRIQFSNLWCMSFPNCLAAAYIYLEGLQGELPKQCNPGSNSGIGKMFITAIEDIKNHHLKLLETINQAIVILNERYRR